MDGEGKVVADGLDPQRYQDFIGEAVHPWSYLKSPYYKPLGFPDGMYRDRPASAGSRDLLFDPCRLAALLMLPSRRAPGSPVHGASVMTARRKAYRPGLPSSRTSRMTWTVCASVTGGAVNRVVSPSAAERPTSPRYVPASG
jgi:hypothetical protein